MLFNYTLQLSFITGNVYHTSHGTCLVLLMDILQFAYVLNVLWSLGIYESCYIVLLEEDFSAVFC